MLLVHETMAPEIRRYIDTQGRAYPLPQGEREKILTPLISETI